MEIGFGFDAVGDLTALTPAGNPTPELRLDYDALGRLTALKDGAANTVIGGYSYDVTGNRLSAKVGGVMQTYTYPTTNHRLSAVAGVARTYDKLGNTLTIGGKAREYLYDTTGRMTQVKRAGAAVMNYRYNGRGEQVRRYLGTTNTYTLYDEAGHWLGDYDTNGAPKQQAIWLDDLPVGLLANGGQLHYIEPDHLGSPRVVVDAARDVAVWSWSLKGEAFGNTAPNQDPDGDGTAMVFDMRFPGQRFDAVSGFNQNYFRDYDAATGRYGQSDPIGLEGGASTYGYVGANPTNGSDPSGLRRLCDCEETSLSKYKGYVDFGRVRILPDFGILPDGTNAMTIGYNIFVNSGVDKPGSTDTIALIAHELEHVFQQQMWNRDFLPNYFQQYFDGRTSGLSDYAAYREIGFEVQGHNAQGAMEHDLLNGGNYCE